MTVYTPSLPDFTSQDASTYKSALDSTARIHNVMGGAFAPHQTGDEVSPSGPDMTVTLEAGYILNGTTLTSVSAQTTGVITAPVSNPRIDRVVIDSTTGAVSVITGSEAASPTAPSITSGNLPVAQVLLQTSSTSITNLMITDERVGFHSSSTVSLGVTAGSAQQVDQSETSTGSATTTTLGTTLKHLITGTTTITAFNGVAGVTYRCTAGGAFTLTHNATNLDILQTGASITTVADDTFDVYMRTASTCEIRNYQRASGTALTGSDIGTYTALSGTAVGVTGISSTTKQIDVNLVGASSSGTSIMIIQIGDSGGYETTGYLGTVETGATRSEFNTGYHLDTGGAGYSLDGTVTLTLTDAATNTWNISGNLGGGAGQNAAFSLGGTKALSGALDRLQITMVNGTDTFDAGNFNIQERN